MSLSKIVLRLYYKLIRMTPDKMPMVRWWKTADAVEAIVTRDKSGAEMMVMQGEKYPIMSFPRSHILVPEHHFKGEAVTLEDRVRKHGAFSVLKHEIKNRVFNDNFDNPTPEKIKESLREIVKHLEVLKYDLMPPESMCLAVREIHRAWTKAVPGELSYKLRDILTFTLQEDDSYKYRVQWLAWWMPFIKINPVHILDKCFALMEHAEALGDMKERIRLLRKVVMKLLEDKVIRDKFEKFFREVNWGKVKLSKGDRYHFSGKYFKVYYGLIEY